MKRYTKGSTLSRNKRGLSLESLLVPDVELRGPANTQVQMHQPPHLPIAGIKLFVSHLKQTSTAVDLHGLFTHFGDVTGVAVTVQNSKTCGLVMFSDVDAANLAMTALNGAGGLRVAPFQTTETRRAYKNSAAAERNAEPGHEMALFNRHTLATAPPVQGITLRVSNLDSYFTVRRLENLLTPFDNVLDIKVMHEIGCSSGLVTFSDIQTASLAAAALDGSRIGTHVLRISYQ